MNGYQAVEQASGLKSSLSLGWMGWKWFSYFGGLAVVAAFVTQTARLFYEKTQVPRLRPTERSVRCSYSRENQALLSPSKLQGSRRHCFKFSISDYLSPHFKRCSAWKNCLIDASAYTDSAWHRGQSLAILYQLRRKAGQMLYHRGFLLLSLRDPLSGRKS